MIIGIIVGIVALILLVTAGLSVKIIREYQRVVLFRLGRALGTRGPGLVFINPVTDRTTWVDLRERFLEIPRQTAITQDNASISIDFIIFYKVIDPSMSVLEVQNFAAAAQNVAATTLRSVVGDMALDDVLSKREEINASLRVRLDEVTERWGVKVTTVEVREVNPPPGVLEAMTRQMSAERTRRAAIIEAQGQKSAAITIAEGAQQSVVLAAEGERQSAILRAEGLSTALEKIRTVGRQLDANTMRLQYYETLKQVGASPSTKLVLPMEIGGLINSLRGLVSGDSGGVQAAEPATPPGGTTPADALGPAVLAEPASTHPPVTAPAGADALGPGAAETNGSQQPAAGASAADAPLSGTSVERNGNEQPVARSQPAEAPGTAPGEGGDGLRAE
jgi:regulator of protease activity HflC (stomatin/prohibitin superfamily)